MVLATGDEPSRYLTAWLVPTAGTQLDPAAVLDQLRRDLPDHLVPSTLVPVDALPLGPNGKVDRAALPAPAAAERMALLVAESRRIDRSSAPLLDLDDLPAAAAHALVWTLAAELRAALHAGGLDAPAADTFAVAAGGDRLARYDASSSVGAVAERLADALAELSHDPVFRDTLRASARA